MKLLNNTLIIHRGTQHRPPNFKDRYLDKQIHHDSDKEHGDEDVESVRKELRPGDSGVTIPPENLHTNSRYDEAEPVKQKEPERHRERHAILETGGDNEDNR